jgi:hypothetical protein
MTLGEISHNYRRRSGCYAQLQLCPGIRLQLVDPLARDN